MNALTPILGYKRDEVMALKANTSLADLDQRAKAAAPVRGFAQSLSAIAETGKNALICELKRKSPSAGDILPGADPLEIAQAYERGGAACLSILTDTPSFGGSLTDLERVRAAVNLPVLRKDFMIDPIQIAEARAYGADAILIIMAAVDDALAVDLEAAAQDYGMDAMIEVHNEAELDRALKLKSPLLGVNNRDLTIMKTDLGVTERLSGLIPKDRSLVSESGVSSEQDIVRLRKVGARRFLIGESLMKRNDRENYVNTLHTCEFIDPYQEHV